jgi:hypothetical protein
MQFKTFLKWNHFARQVFNSFSLFPGFTAVPLYTRIPNRFRQAKLRHEDRCEVLPAVAKLTAVKGHDSEEEAAWYSMLLCLIHYWLNWKPLSYCQIPCFVLTLLNLFLKT